MSTLIIQKDGFKMITHIVKRDGRKDTFNIEKIAKAIYKAAEAVGGTDYNASMELAVKVCDLCEDMYGRSSTPTVEQIQDLVEKVLGEDARIVREFKGSELVGRSYEPLFECTKKAAEKVADEVEDVKAEFVDDKKDEEK